MVRIVFFKFFEQNTHKWVILILKIALNHLFDKYLDDFGIQSVIEWDEWLRCGEMETDGSSYNLFTWKFALRAEMNKENKLVLKTCVKNLFPQ